MRPRIHTALALSISTLLPGCPDATPGLIKSDNLMWARFGGPGDQLMAALASANDGQLVVTGEFDGSAYLFASDGSAHGSFASAGGRDVFLLKLGDDGGYVWGAEYGGPGDDRATALATSEAGDIFLAGIYGDSIDFGGAPLVGSGTECFVARFKPTGEHVWSRSLGANIVVNGLSAAAVADGVVVAGWLDGTAEIDGQSMTAVEQRDAIVLSLHGNGALRWNYQIPGVGDEFANAIAVNDDGTIIVVGGSAGRDGPTDTQPIPPGFIARLDPAGNEIWKDEEIGSIVALGLNSAGKIAISGSFLTSYEGESRVAGFYRVRDAAGTVLNDQDFYSILGRGRTWGTGAAMSVTGNAFYLGQLEWGDGRLETEVWRDVAEPFDAWVDADAIRGRDLALEGWRGLVIGGEFQGSLDPVGIRSDDRWDVFVASWPR